MFQDAEYKRYAAEKVRLNVDRSIDTREMDATRSRAKMESAFDIAENSMLLQLTTYMHGMADERVQIDKKWPKTWWDAFKERWFPKWILSRWPVEYDRIYVDQVIYKAVCPHLQDDEQNQHLEWMAFESERIDPSGP